MHREGMGKGHALSQWHSICRWYVLHLSVRNTQCCPDSSLKSEMVKILGEARHLLVRVVASCDSYQKACSSEDFLRGWCQGSSKCYKVKLSPSRKPTVKHSPAPALGLPTRFCVWDWGAEMNRGLFKVLQPVISGAKIWLGSSSSCQDALPITQIC